MFIKHGFKYLVSATEPMKKQNKKQKKASEKAAKTEAET